MEQLNLDFGDVTVKVPPPKPERILTERLSYDPNPIVYYPGLDLTGEVLVCIRGDGYTLRRARYYEVVKTFKDNGGDHEVFVDVIEVDPNVSPGPVVTPIRTLYGYFLNRFRRPINAATA